MRRRTMGLKAGPLHDHWRSASKVQPASEPTQGMAASDSLLFIEADALHDRAVRRRILLISWLILGFGRWDQVTGATVEKAAALEWNSVTLTDAEPVITMNVLHRQGARASMPVILMLGSLKAGEPPAWSTNLLNEGWMLCAFTAAHPPDPDPKRRPQWLYFDERFAHSYPLAGERAIEDTGRVVDYLRKRPDVIDEKIGWFGSSSTGIPGLAVATQGPRLAAVCVFVSTGAYRNWLSTWEPNGVWRGGKNGLWPESDALLNRVDPILHATNLWPTAVLMVNGAEDKVVDPKSARAFAAAARPSYAPDPNRLRLVMYEGFGHNLPQDVVRHYAENWFRLYLHPVQPPPPAPPEIKSLKEAARQTEINSTEHRRVVGAE